MNAKSGGGITSNKLVRPSVRTGQSATGITPGYTAQLGTSQGNHSEQGTSKYRGEPMRTSKPLSVPLGNQVALNVGKGGPGTGRTVMASGSQATYGPTVGTRPGPGRPIDR